MNEDIKQHIFQTAGLGLAPYKFLGVTENLFTPLGGTAKPGGCCDYCGTAILYEFHLQSADKKNEFKVGSDCIHKSGDAGLAVRVTQHKAKLRRTAAVVRKAKLTAQKIALIDEILLFIDANYETLQKTLHPWGGWDFNTNKPRTWYDYGVWMVRHCSIPGLMKLRLDAKLILTAAHEI